MKKIYILHGWSYTKEKWTPLVDLLEGAGFSVSFPNIPGLTETISRPWKIDDYVSWLDSILVDEKEPVMLIGHSNGGRIAIEYTKSHMNKISHLVLIDSAGVYHRGLFIRIKRLFFKCLAKIGKLITKNEKIRKVFYKFVGEKDYNEANDFTKQTMKNLIKIDSLPSAKIINIPTLLVWGSDDRVTPLSDAKKLAHSLEYGTLDVVLGAKHSPQFTHIKEVFNSISNFYKKHV